MRIVDLLHPHLGGVRTVLDASPGSIELSSYLRLPAGVAAEPLPREELFEGERRIDEGELLVLLTGPDPELHDDLDVLDGLFKLQVGARALVLFGYDGPSIPLPLVLAAFGEARCQVLVVHPLQYMNIRVGVVAERVEAPLPLTPYLQRQTGANPPVDRAETALRLANEYQFLDLRSRFWRARLDELERDNRSPDEGLRERVQALLAERQQLESARRRADEQLRAAQRRLELVEGSTAFLVGQAIATAAKQPGTEVVRLPKRLWGLYRGRGRVDRSRSVGARGGRASSTEPTLATGGEDRLFLAQTPALLIPESGLSLAGIWRDATRRALEPDCAVNTLLPHDALLALERCEPHAVIIEAAAARPGHPWAFSGTTVGLERDLVIADLLAAARAAGIPVVFWANAPSHEAPGLAAVAAGCDLIVGEPGTGGATAPFAAGLQLAEHNPIDLPSERPPAVVLVGPPGAVRAPPLLPVVLQAAAAGPLRIYDDLSSIGGEDYDEDLAGHVVGALPWRLTAAVYRKARVCLAVASPGPDTGEAVDVRTLEQLACGARVIRVDGAAPRNPADEWSLAIHAESDTSGVLRRALEAPPRTAGDVRLLLRSLAPGRTVRSQLDGLATTLGLRVSAGTQLDVSVLVDAPASADLSVVAESLASQRHLPAEVVVAVGDADAVAGLSNTLAELEGLGIAVRPVVSAGAGAARLAQLANAASSPWVLAWRDEERDPSALLDLAIAAECGRPDAVGLSATGDMVFTADLPVRGSLLRRALLVRDGVWPDSLSGWHRGGRRLLGLEPLAETSVAP